MASGPPTVSTPTNHPVLGPSDAILDDRSHSLGGVFLYAAFTLIGFLGIVLGINDSLSPGASAAMPIGGPTLGVLEIGGGIVVAIYAMRVVVAAFRRYRQPMTIVIGQDGFDYIFGNGPVMWDEVDTISDPYSPADQPKAVKVQVSDVDAYMTRHNLSALARLEMRFNKWDLSLGRDTIMPVVEVQNLMRKRLAEYRRLQHDDSAAPQPARPKLRRPLPKG